MYTSLSSVWTMVSGMGVVVREWIVDLLVNVGMYAGVVVVTGALVVVV